MTRDDIIKMAKEAGFDPHDMSDDFTCNLEDIERFASLVAAAVAEPEQEPVAWANESDLPNFDMKVRTGPDLHHTVPLYTAPPKKEWVGLTDEEVSYCRYAATFCDELDTAYMAELIEQALKEKNHG